MLHQTTTLLTQNVTSVPTFSQLLTFNNVSAPSFTINGAANKFTYNKTQPLNTGLNLNVSLSLTSLATFTKNLWTLSVLKNGNQILFESETVTIVPLGGTNVYNFAISGGISLALNDYFEIRLTGDRCQKSGVNSMKSKELNFHAYLWHFYTCRKNDSCEKFSSVKKLL